MSMIEDTTSGMPGMATMMTMTEEVEQAKSHDTAEQPAFAATTTTVMAAAAAAESGLNQLRRVRRARTQYEKLQRPADIAPGAPTPSIEGWVLFLTNLPSTTTVEDIQDLFVSFKPGVPDYFGALHEVKIPLDKDCLCPGYALVELESRQGYERALAEMQDAPITYAAQDVEGANNNNSGEDGSVTPSLLPRLRLAPAFLAEEDDEDADAALDATTHATAGAAMPSDSAGQKRVRHNDEDDDEEAMTSRKDDVHGDGQHDGSGDDAEDGEAHGSEMPEHKRAKHESDVVVDDEEEQGGDAPATDMQDDSVGATSSQ